MAIVCYACPDAAGSPDTASLAARYCRVNSGIHALLSASGMSAWWWSGLVRDCRPVRGRFVCAVSSNLPQLRQKCAKCHFGMNFGLTFRAPNRAEMPIFIVF